LRKETSHVLEFYHPEPGSRVATSITVYFPIFDLPRDGFLGQGLKLTCYTRRG
jgi:hypothetical protein